MIDIIESVVYLAVIGVIGLILLIPAVAIAVRLGFKPIVDSWARVRQPQHIVTRGSGENGEDVARLVERVQSLEETLETLRLRVESVEEKRDFDRLLVEGRGTGAAAGEQSAGEEALRPA